MERPKPSDAEVDALAEGKNAATASFLASSALLKLFSLCLIESEFSKAYSIHSSRFICCANDACEKSVKKIDTARVKIACFISFLSVSSFVVVVCRNRAKNVKWLRRRRLTKNENLKSVKKLDSGVIFFDSGGFSL